MWNMTLGMHPRFGKRKLYLTSIRIELYILRKFIRNAFLQTPLYKSE